MEESRKIKLALGKVSWEKELGSYYIDMRPAKIHYTNNIFGGKFDELGVPMIKADGQDFYFPINIAQYGFMIHADWLEFKKSKDLELLKNCLAVLESLKEETVETAVWWHHHYNHKYQIPPPWASAMAQGEVISFYLRIYEILGDEKLLGTALKAYNFLKLKFENGGVRRYDENGDLWFEEYPSEKPSYVLNGFIYTLFGLMDLFRVTENQEVKKDLDAGIITLKKNLHKFDVGYWSRYDLLKKELVRYFYQKNVHVPQLEVLFLLTKEPVFKHFKEKWERNLNPMNFLFVQLMYRIQPRAKNLSKLWKKN